MSEWTEKVRSIGHMRHKGTSRERVVRREDNGRVAGKETEHWNDRVDAVAMPQPAEMHISLRGQEEA